MRLRSVRSFANSQLAGWLLTGVSVAFIGCGDGTSSANTPATTTTVPTAPAPVTPTTPATVTPPPVTPSGNPSVTPPVTPPTPVTPPVTPTTPSVTPPAPPPPATTTAPTTDPTTVPTTTADPTSDTSAPTSEPPTAVEWTKSGNTWSVTLGDAVFEVDAGTGARITGFALGGTQIIVPESAVASSNAGNENNYGSTFTLSPQAESGWPPPEHIDTDNYAGQAEGAVLTLASDDGDVNGSSIQVTKVFTADATNGTVSIDYQVTNTSGASASWAPWQVTRVPRNGITFFPTGNAVSGVPAELTIEAAGGYDFWKYDANDVDEHEWGDKYVGDGTKGWLAHAHDGVMLLMQFDDIAPAAFAEGEGEIEIYASKDDAYVEIEPQGAYAPIAAGATLSWTVKWSLHAIPQEVAEEPSAALGDFADGLATQLGAP